MSSYSAVVFRCTVTERLRQVASTGFDVQVPAWLPEELILLMGEGLFADLAHLRLSCRVAACYRLKNHESIGTCGMAGKNRDLRL